MKICCVSDLHGHLPSIPDCDLLLVAGDLVPTCAHHPLSGRRWLDTSFRSWLEQLANRDIEVVGIAGNHDFVFESRCHNFRIPLPWYYLEEDSFEIRGLRIYGLPHQLRFGDYAFNLDEPDLAARYSQIPDVDVLLTHGPPLGLGDKTRGRHVGSPSLLQWIRTNKPRLVVTGHIHGGYGVYESGPTTIVNCAYLDDYGIPSHRPVLLDLLEDVLQVVECDSL